MDTEALVEAATTARQRAYAPYSGFRMGAAVLTTEGNVLTGSLVENVSLGLAMCAERVALFSTIAVGERPSALVLVSPRTDGAVTFPCGACLQVGLELGGPDLAVIAATPDGEIEHSTVAALLPRGPHKTND
jgi:cytidine deaminase